MALVDAEGHAAEHPESDVEPALRQPIGVGHCRRPVYLTPLDAGHVLRWRPLHC